MWIAKDEVGLVEMGLVNISYIFATKTVPAVAFTSKGFVKLMRDPEPLADAEQLVEINEVELMLIEQWLEAEDTSTAIYGGM